jgi:hypothetical protein
VTDKPGVWLTVIAQNDTLESLTEVLAAQFRERLVDVKRSK